jgi:hypothetical protein
MVFREKVIERKISVWFPLQISFETLLTIIRIRGDIIINGRRALSKVIVIVVRF